MVVFSDFFSLAADTIFMALVIFSVEATEVMRARISFRLDIGAES